MDYKQLIALGYRLYPCVYGKKGVLPEFATMEAIGGRQQELFGSIVTSDGIVKDGQSPTDEQYEMWFKKQSNYQAFCGHAGNLIALDFDCVLDKEYRKDDETDEEYKFRCKVIDFYEKLPKSHEVRSASGKRHIHFAYDASFPKSIQLLPYLEIKSNGLCIMMPGSVFISPSTGISEYSFINTPTLERPKLPVEELKSLIDSYYTEFPNTARAKQTAKAYEQILSLGKKEKIKDGRRTALLSEAARLATFGLQPKEIERTLYGIINMDFDNKDDYLRGGSKFHTVEGILKDIYSGRLGDPEKAAQYIQGRFNDFTKEIGGGSGIQGYFAKERVQQYKSNMLSPKPPKITLGYNWLSERLGSPMAGCIYVFAAPSGNGKTHLSIHYANELSKQGKKVMYFLLEGDFENHFYKKEIFQISNKNLPGHEKFKSYSNFLQDNFTKLQSEEVLKASDEIMKLPLWENTMMFDCSSNLGNDRDFKVKDVCKKIELLAKEGFTHVVIDHLQLLTAESGTEEFQKILENMKVLRKCVDSCGVTMILPAQLNRSSYQTKNDLSADMIAGSSEIINYCDVMMMYRKNGKLKGSSQIKDGKLQSPHLQPTEFSIIKHRYNPELVDSNWFVNFDKSQNKYENEEVITINNI